MFVAVTVSLFTFWFFAFLFRAPLFRQPLWGFIALRKPQGSFPLRPGHGNTHAGVHCKETSVDLSYRDIPGLNHNVQVMNYTPYIHTITLACTDYFASQIFGDKVAHPTSNSPHWHPAACPHCLYPSHLAHTPPPPPPPTHYPLQLLKTFTQFVALTRTSTYTFLTLESLPPSCLTSSLCLDVLANLRT